LFHTPCNCSESNRPVNKIIAMMGKGVQLVKYLTGGLGDGSRLIFLRRLGSFFALLLVFLLLRYLPVGGGHSRTQQAVSAPDGHRNRVEENTGFTLEKVFAGHHHQVFVIIYIYICICQTLIAFMFTGIIDTEQC